MLQSSINSFREKKENYNKKKSIKNIMDTLKKPFSYMNIKNDKKYYLYSPISESTMANLDVDSSGSENGYNTLETNTPSYQKDSDHPTTTYTQSDPSKLIYVPKHLAQSNTNSNNNSNATNQNNNNQDTPHLHKDNEKSLSNSPIITTASLINNVYNNNNNNNDTNNNNNNIIINNNNNNNVITNITFSTFSDILFPWYLKKKRQSSFSNTDIKSFYNFNKCNNYEKYENYFSRDKEPVDPYIDIALDKNAIELKELHTTITDNDIINNSPSKNLTQESSEKSECTNDIVEKEIAQAMNGIALKDVISSNYHHTNNVIHVLEEEGDVEDISNTMVPSLNMDTDQYIENNVTFEFQQDKTFPVVSPTNVYPPNSFDIKNKNYNNEMSASLQTQYPVLSSIENYSEEEFII